MIKKQLGNLNTLLDITRAIDHINLMIIMSQQWAIMMTTNNATNVSAISVSRNAKSLVPPGHQAALFGFWAMISVVGLLVAGLLSQSAQAAMESNERLAAVVQVDSVVPASARTAGGLGTRRTGTGVVIDDQGLVLTIGYVILEAIEVSVQGPGGRSMPANVIAYDHETGFGLVRTNTPIDVEPMPLGDANRVKRMEQLLVASRVGKLDAKGVYLVDRKPFAGYWEYLLDDACSRPLPMPSSAERH